MAFVNLSGILTNSIGGIDVGATLKMTHLSTTGDTLSSTITELIIPPNGAYDIDLNFGIVRFDYTTDFTQVFLAITTINADTTATTIAELLNSIVDPTSPQLLLFQDILADAQTAETNAAASAAAAAISEANTAGIIDRLNPDTLAIAVADSTLQEDDTLNFKSRVVGFSGSAGASFADVVLTSSVTPNGVDIIQSTGNPLLSIVLRLESVFLDKNTFIDTDVSYDFAAVLRREASNQPVRQYLIPNGVPSGNTKSSIKVFFDDFVTDPANYRDFNITCTHNFNGGVVSNDAGDDSALLLNMKTLGSFRKQAPDVVFCYNDAISTADIGGRMVQFFDVPSVGNRLTRWIFGTGTTFLSKEDDIAFFEGSLGIQHGSGLRLQGSDLVGDTVINRLNASNELEDQIRAGFVFVKTQFGRSSVGYNSTETFSAPFASSKTFSIRDGGYQKVFVTGAMTVASIINMASGDEITLHLTADASNRVVTWPAVWLTQTPTITIVASTTTVVKLRFDGSSVVQQSIVDGLS